MPKLSPTPPMDISSYWADANTETLKVYKHNQWVKFTFWMFLHGRVPKSFYITIVGGIMIGLPAFWIAFQDNWLRDVITAETIGTMALIGMLIGTKIEYKQFIKQNIY
jgi:hypothetical protein